MCGWCWPWYPRPPKNHWPTNHFAMPLIFVVLCRWSSQISQRTWRRPAKWGRCLAAKNYPHPRDDPNIISGTVVGPNFAVSVLRTDLNRSQIARAFGLSSFGPVLGPSAIHLRPRKPKRPEYYVWVISGVRVVSRRLFVSTWCCPGRFSVRCGLNPSSKGLYTYLQSLRHF